jgi:hypothetical protein
MDSHQQNEATHTKSHATAGSGGGAGITARLADAWGTVTETVTEFRENALDLTVLDGFVSKKRTQILEVHGSVEKRVKDLLGRVSRVKVLNLTHEDVVRTSRTIVEVPYDTLQKRVALSALPFVHLAIPLVKALDAQLANLEGHLKEITGPDGEKLVERVSRITVTIASRAATSTGVKEVVLD